MAGSGAVQLSRHRDWARHLLNMIKAHENQRISSSLVAQEFAKVNQTVSQRITDNSVGPRCVVSWTYRKNGKFGGGGGLECYEGLEKENNCGGMPTIANGMDVQGIIRGLMPFMNDMMNAFSSGRPVPELDRDKINERLSREPHLPDEFLR